MYKNFTMLILGFFVFSAFAQKNTIIDHKCIDLQKIPDLYITKAKAELHIYFAHASHGANLTEGGMTAIMNYSATNAEKYSFNTTGSGGALHLYEDLGDYYPPLTDWNKRARAYIANNPTCNVMIWGPSNSFVNGENNTGSVGYNNAKAFIDTVEKFIQEFGPGSNRPVPISFVYMTPPALSRYYSNWAQPMDKYSIGVYRADSLIRKHCIANNRWLFEFYDLSTHNPDGANFGGMKDDYTYDATKRALDDASYSLSDANHTRANWAIDWVNANPTSENALMAADNICVKCQHSDGIPNGGSTPNNARLTCVMKGKAAWWLWARLAGWEETPGSNSTQNTDDLDIHLYPNPVNNILYIQFDDAKNINAQIRIKDLTGKVLINNLNYGDYSQTSVDVSSLKSGVYLIEISCGNKILNSKFLVQ